MRQYPWAEVDLGLSAVWWRGAPLPTRAPIVAAVRGAAAGLLATLLLSLLARVLPGMSTQPGGGQPPGQPRPPQDPFNPRAVQAWQTHAQAPGRCEEVPGSGGRGERQYLAFRPVPLPPAVEYQRP